MINQFKQRITAVIVAYRSLNQVSNIEKTLRLFESFIIVDNSPEPQYSVSREIKKIFPNGTFPNNNKNLGYGAGNNLALKHVDTEYALIINPDLEIDEDAIQSMLGTADAYPSAVIVGAVIFDSRLHKEQVSYGWSYPDSGGSDYVVPDGDTSTFWLSGCCLLIRVKPFLELGGFDEKFFMYYEEYDICQRVIQAGGDCILSAAAHVKHNSQSSSTPSLRVEYLKTLHWNKSKQIFLNKYGHKKKSTTQRTIRFIGYLLIGLLQLITLNFSRAVKSFAMAHSNIIIY